MDEKLLEITMSLVIHGGNAKAKAAQAIEFAKAGDFESADICMREADAEVMEAHHSQTGLLTSEADGDHCTVNLLLVHGQDHLMNAITYIDLAKEICEIYRKVQQPPICADTL